MMGLCCWVHAKRVQTNRALGRPSRFCRLADTILLFTSLLLYNKRKKRKRKKTSETFVATEPGYNHAFCISIDLKGLIFAESFGFIQWRGVVQCLVYT